MDRNQVLNEIKKFAERYKIEKALNKIGSLDAKSDENYVRLTVKECLAIIYKFVLESIDEELDLEDNLKCETTLNITKGQFDSIMVAIDNKKGYFMKTHNFLKFASIIMNRYSKDYKKEVATSEELVIVEESNPELDRKISVNGKRFATAVGIVVVCGAIIACATKCSNKPASTKDTNEQNKPSIESPSTPSTPETPAKSTEDEKLANLEYATQKTYEDWSNITSDYTKEDICEVIKALNGLESSISINEADDILNDILNKAIEPKINSLTGFNDYELVGANGRAKVLDLSLLILDKDVRLNYYNTQVGMMNTIMNNLIIGNEMKESADKSLTIELDVIANGTLNNATPIEKILFSRTSIYSGVIAGVASETFDNGALIDSLEDMAVEAMQNTKGLTK